MQLFWSNKTEYRSNASSCNFWVVKTQYCDTHGFFTYQIRLKDSIATGTRFENKAAIYFDFNAPS